MTDDDKFDIDDKDACVVFTHTGSVYMITPDGEDEDEVPYHVQMAIATGMIFNSPLGSEIAATIHAFWERIVDEHNRNKDEQDD